MRIRVFTKMKKEYLLGLLLFLQFKVHSRPNCWILERTNSNTSAFSSFTQWDSEKQSWMSCRPKSVAPYYLLSAYKIFKRDKSIALSIGTDKQAHCYLGCKMAKEINFETARYVAWLKEYYDLIDCDSSTHFEPNDFAATVYGARQGVSLKNKSCEDLCSNIHF